MSDSEGRGMDIEVFAGLPWYEERPETELELDGILERVPAGQGPSDRAALTYTLRCADGVHPVYAAGVAERLATMDGQRVRARGRLIDLRAEGGVQELWMGTIIPRI